MKITNPATGAVLVDVVADNAKAVRAKYERARAAQPKWAATSDQEAARRHPRVPRDRRGAQPELARTLSLEVGKPIRQSRNELNGLTGRIDFFLSETERALRDEKVFADAARQDGGAHRRTSRSASSPTSRPGTIRTSSAATCSCRRSPPATPCSTSPPSSRRSPACTSPTCCTRRACPTTCSSPVDRRRQDRHRAPAPAGRRRVLHRLVSRPARRSPPAPAGA